MSFSINNTSDFTIFEPEYIKLPTIPLTRRCNTPEFLTYKNNNFTDQHGNLTTLAHQHSPTLEQIHYTIRNQRELSNITDNTQFKLLFDNYTTELPSINNIPIYTTTTTTTGSPFFLEKPKLIATKREKVDLGLDNLPWITDNSWNEILGSATTPDGL